MSSDRPDLLQRLNVLPSAIRQWGDDMGCLHLLLEYLLECYCRTERYVVVVAILRVRGKASGKGVGENSLPRIHTFGTRDGC